MKNKIFPSRPNLISKSTSKCEVCEARLTDNNPQGLEASEKKNEKKN